MNGLVRRPLTWIVAGEVLVVAALAAFTWHFLAGLTGAHTPPAAPPAVSEPAPPEPQARVTGEPAPHPRVTRSTGPVLGPGAVPDPGRTYQREWALLESVVDFARTYIRERVLPAVEAAAKGQARGRP